MKKILLFASALAGLFLAGSCQKETLEPMKGDTKVTFEVSAGDVATKAIADATNIDVLYWEIYNTADIETATTKPLGEGTVREKDGDKKFYVELLLLADQKYTIVFWAQVDGKTHYDVSDLRSVKIDDYDDESANDESRAAFFATYSFSTENGVNIEEDITLYRPFSQINLGATTYETSFNNVNGGQVKVESTEMTVTSIATSFNTLEGVGEGSQAVTFVAAATPNGTDDQTQKILAVNGENYYWLGMNYLIVNGNSDNVKVDMTLNTNLGTVTHSVDNVPVKENYRTNILGNLLTTGASFNIIVDERFEGEYYGPEFVKKPSKNDAGEWVINEPLELVWLAAAVNGTLPPQTKASAAETFEGETFILGADIDLDGMDWTPIGATGNFMGTFDGKDKTISNFVVRTEGRASAGLFAKTYGTIKNLTVSGAEIYGHYKAGVIVGDGLCSKIENCHVVDAVVESTPYNNDDANHVGGIVGYLSAESTAYVKGSSVTNSIIKGYRDVGGIAGTANGPAVVTGNTVSETTVEADLTDDYVDNTKDCNAGAIAGRVSSKATVSDNTVGEEVDVIRRVDSNEEFAHALDEYAEGDVVYVYHNVNHPNYDYVFPSSKIKADTKIVFEEGTYVSNGYDAMSLNIKGATIEGARFSGYGDITATGTVNGRFINCYFEGGNVLRYCYAGETVYFENCTFDPRYPYGVHFDGGENPVTFKDCTFKNWNSFGGAITDLQFDGCTFNPGMYNEYNVLRVYGKTTVKDCTFDFTTKATTEGIAIDAANSESVMVEFENCVVKEADENTYSVFSRLTNYAEGDKIKVDGVVYTFAADGLVTDDSNNEYPVSAEGLQKMLQDKGIDEINLIPGHIYEGRFDIKDYRDVTISTLDATKKATIKGRVNIQNSPVSFKDVRFDRNAEADKDWPFTATPSNWFKYKAIVMIYGAKDRITTFEGCEFLNCNGIHKSAINNIAGLVVNNCSFEGTGSAIYSKTSLSVTNCTINFVNSSPNAFASLDGRGNEGGYFVFTGNRSVGNDVFVASQFLSTTTFGNGEYLFNVQDNSGFTHYYYNTSKVTNPKFESGSLTF